MEGNYSVPCLGHIAFGKNRENKISVSLLFYYEKWITFECNCQMLFFRGLLNHNSTIAAK